VRLALLGNPVEHSLSPLIQSAALRASGVAGTYEARKVDDDGMRVAFHELRSGLLDGFNVTMPYKALTASLCDRLEPDAKTARSVNTVVRENDEVVGYSTDIGGIRAAWDGLPLEGPVLILGAGGAASAAAVALSGRPIYIAARRFGAGSELGKRVGIEVSEVRWGVSVVSSVVVNCTPLGMNGESLPKPVLELASGLFDMAYGEAPTPAVKAVVSTPLPVVDGVEFLLAQAGISFSLWTGMPAPLSEMRKAVENRSRP
jgi:shikimate dehydrogenase